MAWISNVFGFAISVSSLAAAKPIFDNIEGRNKVDKIAGRVFLIIEMLDLAAGFSISGGSDEYPAIILLVVRVE